MPGSIHPFSPMTTTDHRGWLWITVIISTVISPAIFLWRGIARYRKYGLDDLAIFISFVLVMAHSALLMGSLKFGFGVSSTPISQSSILESAKLVFASRILLSIILCTSQTSALLLLRRLMPAVCWRVHACDVGVALASIWCIMAILTTSISCSPTHMLHHNAEQVCHDLDIRISTTMALNIATELGVFGLAMRFLPHMQVEPAQRKQVIATFSLRLPNIALGLTYLFLYLHFLTTGHSSIAFIPTALTQQLLITYSFISSTISAIFSFSVSSPPPSAAFELKPSLSFSRKKISRAERLARRMSTPLSFFGDTIRGDREVFKHKTKVFADVKGVERRESERRLRAKNNSGEREESIKGIVRENTFEIKMDQCSDVDMV